MPRIEPGWAMYKANALLLFHSSSPRNLPLSSPPVGLGTLPGSLLIVEDDVRDPNHLGRDTEGRDVSEVSWVPAQLVIRPLLPTRGVPVIHDAWGGGHETPQQQQHQDSGPQSFLSSLNIGDPQVPPCSTACAHLALPLPPLTHTHPPASEHRISSFETLPPSHSHDTVGRGAGMLRGSHVTAR